MTITQAACTITMQRKSPRKIRRTAKTTIMIIRTLTRLRSDFPRRRITEQMTQSIPRASRITITPKRNLQVQPQRMRSSPQTQRSRLTVRCLITRLAASHTLRRAIWERRLP